MTEVKRPTSPRLFLVDGYAIIYRAFFALLTRPLQSSRGENTSAAWGIANFLKRLQLNHKPEYLGWVHDSGATFRDELYPEYKATREKLTDELQADFDQGLERISQLLAAYNVPILAETGFEADDVIGTLAQKGVDAGLNVVIVSGDKDFQQLVRPGVWLLNPGRGGPASVDEQWVGMENASDRLGVPPERVTDYLALVGDSSDNVPGVKGIGDKTAVELIKQFGPIEEIIAHVHDITKKRPREALLEHEDSARLSKQLVTIRCDVPTEFDKELLRFNTPDRDALRSLYLELEFTSLLKDVGGSSSALSGALSKTQAELSSDSSSKAANDSSVNATGSADTPQRPVPPAVVQGESGVPILAASRYHTVNTINALNDLTAKLTAAGRFAVDVHTIGEPNAPSSTDPMRSLLVGVSLATDVGEVFYLPLKHSHDDGSGNLGLLSGDSGIAGNLIGEGATVPDNLPPLDSSEMEGLRSVFADPAVAKVAHDSKRVVHVLHTAGVQLNGVEFDTMLASYVLDPGRRSHGLELLAFEFLGHIVVEYETVGGKGRYQLSFDTIPTAAARDYACQNVDIVLRLYPIFVSRLQKQEMLELYTSIEMPLVNVLARMEWEGIAIDLAWFTSLKQRLQSEREKVEQEIYSEAGEEFNINSNPKLRAILFDKLGLPVIKKTATGPSTDASVLQELAEDGHTLPTLLMEYRELFKLEGTYIDALPKLVHPRDGRLHTSFNQTVAATGRLSSSDPNLQNIPIRRELGRAIRRGFVPRSGWKLLSADYSQIELRLLAHLSGDPAFVAAFRAGGDVHRQTAAVIFGIDVELVTAEMRARAKTINFATIYGQGAHALSRQLRISHAEAKAFIETYFERFSGVRAFMDKCVAEARERGYVETLFRRRRYIPELKERNFNIRAFGERVAANAPIQGSAADLIKIAMINIDRAIAEKAYQSRMLLQVHDELVFEVAPGEEEPFSAMVKSEMEGAATLDVPLLVDYGIGTNWLDVKG